MDTSKTDLESARLLAKRIDQLTKKYWLSKAQKKELGILLANFEKLPKIVRLRAVDRDYS